MLNVHNVLNIEIKLEILKKLESENIKFAKVYNIGKYISIAIKKWIKWTITCKFYIIL